MTMFDRVLRGFVACTILNAIVYQPVAFAQNKEKPMSKPNSDTATLQIAAMNFTPDDWFKSQVGSWEAEVSLWPRPNSKPIKSRAVVTSQLVLDEKSLEQRIDGTFGPELGGKSWSSISHTRYDKSARRFEMVRMSSSDSPMIVLYGSEIEGKKGDDSKVTSLIEVKGDYVMMGMKAMERDVIRMEGNDKCVVESWMSFDGSPEFLGSEMIFTRVKKSTPDAQSFETKNLRLGNPSISLAVKDLKVSHDFYESIGFHLIAGNEKNYVIMQNDASTIGLFQGMLPKNMLTYNPGWDRNTKLLSDFDDVRDIQKRLKSLGIALTVSADETTTGPASCMIQDPDGNIILIDQHVPRP